ncbi:GNAT family N-acetyltransferase [Paenibacillus filicis]|uniref:GNAT family N-acetyltransferase n=1 Tax=Paenibacillus gyeongsangnamensis TaxID=3388067 RepID=A0ABT4QCB9_9BACL|nr:GNAT family N-acetyltransferase [Paenibacillus filicis]MCZ8514538.1 GNAT family N-acetyltransferase [Paenibacillus filicis]
MIREAAAADCLAVERLYRLLVPANPRIRVLPERIEELRKSGDHFLLVYEQPEAIVGTLQLHLCPDTMFVIKPYALIENVIVDPHVRGQGVGTALMAYADSLCLSRSCTKIMLLSNAERKGAHAFFQQCGYNGHVSKGFKKYLRTR